jgi:glycerophosphoryl diester phosphodiesterase
VAAADCQTWSPHYRNARPDEIAAARALGLKVIPWTVNERADMERLIAQGVDGIITDYPDRLRAVMAARDMPLPPQAEPR